MAEEKKPVDYMTTINRARKKRNRPPYGKYAAIAAVVCVVAGSVYFCGRAISGGNPSENKETVEAAAEGSSVAAETLSAEEIEASIEASKAAEEAAKEEQRQKDIQAVIDSYSNLGIVKVSGYLNIRKTPEAGAHVIGKLQGDGACEILETLDGWYKIRSGGIEGYVSSQYVLTGDRAKEEAKSCIAERAVITVNNLNIRKEPSTTADIMGQCLLNERYEIVGESDGWYQIASGYISSDYAEKKLCLNEARKLDLKAMVLNYYEKPGVSNVSDYLNIREGAGKDAKVIAKLPSYAGCEILETLDGWYKIRSGNITGYVSSEFILTGDAAREAAMEHAELMAVVSTDKLNARTEPSTESPIWTQISNNERYDVVSQQDGWVEIEFDETSDDGEPVRAFVSSEFVEVRYGLDEAIKFSQAEIEATENASKRSQIVNYALQFLGGRYVWGGNSLTKGVDCSGFTQQVLKHFGISIPRVSRDQANSGRKVTSSEMKPGDLVFYANSRGTINHVAMYIGNGQVVHAASRKSGIKISTWNYRTPVRIRNVID